MRKFCYGWTTDGKWWHGDLCRNASASPSSPHHHLTNAPRRFRKITLSFILLLSSPQRICQWTCGPWLLYDSPTPPHPQSLLLQQTVTHPPSLCVSPMWEEKMALDLLTHGEERSRRAGARPLLLSYHTLTPWPRGRGSGVEDEKVGEDLWGKPVG